MKRIWLLIAITMMSGATAALAQSTQFRQVFTSDSIIPSFAMTSPDGKWVVMARPEGASASSLWLAPIAGGVPMRLTSSGYNDVQPAWFASGDRIVFMSTRPNRNGGRQQYLMTLGIDPATGRANGTPRQVTSEPVHLRARPSADGRWLLYVTPEPFLLKFVPANGGTARTLGPASPIVDGLTFSPDGRHAYYTQPAGTGGRWCRPQLASDCLTWTIKRVAVDGGASVDVATTTHAIRVLPADPRYVQHRVPGTLFTWELRDSTGRALGRIEFPDGTSTGVSTGDGYGYVAIQRDKNWLTRLATVAGGPTRTLTSDERWIEAWTQDGSGVITDRTENGRVIVEVTALNGTRVAQHTLPEGAQRSGWASDVGPWFAYFTGPRGLSVLNVVTGETKQISNDAGGSGGGRGGLAQDGPRLVYSEDDGKQLTFKSTDPATGATTTLRSFPNGGVRRGTTSAHGSWLAWTQVRGDSIDVMLSEDAGKAPRRLMSLRSAMNGVDLSWNWKGDRIAVCSGQTANPTLTVFQDPTSSGSPIARQDIPLPPAASTCWAPPQWLPDDSGLLLLISLDRREQVPDIVHLSLSPGAQLKVLTQDDPSGIFEYNMSPDGRYAAYPVPAPVTRASIHVASFKGLIEGRR